MPSEVANPKAGVKPGAKPGAKKPMMGIPTWGWIAAIGIGLVIGYFALRKSSSASSGTNDSGASSNPLGANAGTGGGASSQASPPDTIPLISTITDPGVQDGGSGDSSTSTNPTGPASPFQSSPSAPSDLPVAGVAANAPVSSYHVPGTIDSFTGGVASHPQQTSTYYPQGYVAPNYAALNTPTGVNAHRPGFQI